MGHVQYELVLRLASPYAEMRRLGIAFAVLAARGANERDRTTTVSRVSLV